MSTALAGYTADHALPLATLDPDTPFDDLEPLAARFRAARVVAIGESAHFVREYYWLRHRLLRFLVERCGFTAFAMESGFSEGLEVDSWVRGGPGDLDTVADRGITYRMGRCPEMRAHLSWMRSASVPFAGLDVPGSAASPLPALRNIRRYVDGADPGAVPLVDELINRVEKYASESTLTALAAYTQLDRADRDAVTAGLADLAVWFDATQGTAARDAHDVVRHELRLACLLDHGLRSQAAQILAGSTAHPPVSARDRGMAESVFWLLDRFGPDAKIVIGAANNHIQRAPFTMPGFELSVAGTHLAYRLGDAYVAVAVTSTGGTTTTRRANPVAPGGVEIAGAELGPPADGSIEAVLSGLSVVDLRGARGRVAGPDSIRVMDIYQPTPVLDAFDLVVNIPRVSPSAQVTG
ncbi:erythromycin esterase family protein [Pseudonocardia xinjiangensis]|uniref:Erythromycin esterase family protein n=1 Tax=Pseudonocardia xinjiangensis TaxID=75289 RepID=A0ABX1RFE0_9PSEU|nr:erythromycin esterase family protein [Pseudonocardia xinjiangensis]NMH79125.1 erythromycin esterase family protein [Pseudonocardia xinjiangensis]